MLTFEPALSPDSSWPRDGIVQSSLDEDLVDCCVACGCRVVVA
jgi:hypothetical protein